MTQCEAVQVIKLQQRCELEADHEGKHKTDGEDMPADVQEAIEHAFKAAEEAEQTFRKWELRSKRWMWVSVGLCLMNTGAMLNSLAAAWGRSVGVAP